MIVGPRTGARKKGEIGTEKEESWEEEREEEVEM